MLMPLLRLLGPPGLAGFLLPSDGLVYVLLGDGQDALQSVFESLKRRLSVAIRRLAQDASRKSRNWIAAGVASAGHTAIRPRLIASISKSRIGASRSNG